MIIFNGYYSELTIHQKFLIFLIYFFNLGKNLPKDIVMTFRKVVCLAGRKVISVGNIKLATHILIIF